MQLKDVVNKTKTSANLAARNLADLQGILKFLREENLLTTVKSIVNVKHEMAGVASRFDGGKAVLFESLSHKSKAPLFTGLYWNRAVLAAIFNTEEKNLPFFMADSVANWQKGPVNPIVVESGPANEVILDKNEDMLKQIPIPTLALKDGGPYLDSCVLIAKDPETGVRNASIQRLMVAGPNRLTMQLDMGRHLRDYYERAEKMGVPLEVTINNGVGPAVHFAAVTPSNAASLDQDELGVASELLGEPLRLLRSQEVEVEGIADAQYIIEGEILPYTRELEGPFGEVTGYYAEQDNRWVIQVKAVTRREKPIFHAIMPGREVYNAVGLMAEASIFHQVSSQVPDVKGVFLTYGGCGFYHAVVQIEKSREGVQIEAIYSTFSAFPPLRRVTVVDEDVNIYDPLDVEWAIATRHDPDKGVILLPNARGHELNPMTINGIGTKTGIDATAPFPRPRKFQRVILQDVNLQEYKIER
ncbi:UbiD family decarboxylase [Neobacillus mesonae]|uniref:UbiD family decarboxylase n=1 Tax=Neobacillus mesonae TaxID=1193713 RepID=UPI00203DFA73|nr:UbiD family decarboxylase [Neobacillus mesonae]MCM3568662.1 UbiD family decarboxylase [Neobacillus mesonae]